MDIQTAIANTHDRVTVYKSGGQHVVRVDNISRSLHATLEDAARHMRFYGVQLALMEFGCSEAFATEQACKSLSMGTEFKTSDIVAGLTIPATRVDA